MGWSSCSNWRTRQDIIKEVLSPSNNSYPDGRQGVCLESCYKGGPTNGRLWVLFEKPLKSDPSKSHRFIILYLLQKTKGDREWAYKDISEHMGPYEVDCPLRFLEQAPLDQIEGDIPGSASCAPAWRERVKAYHANKVKLADIEVGKTYELVRCKIPHITVTSKHPLRGEYQGISYSLPKKLIGGLVALDNMIGAVVDACLGKTNTP